MPERSRGTAVDEAWVATRRTIATSFDRIATRYCERFADKLRSKPSDVAIVAAAAVGMPSGLAVEVGAGPGQVSEQLIAMSRAVAASDASAAQVATARQRNPELPVFVADLCALPFRPASIAGVFAYYCVMYGSADALDVVFSDWHKLLMPGGVAFLAVHAGVGHIQTDCFEGISVDIDLMKRDPDDLCARLERSGFAIEACVVRAPFTYEVDSQRCFVVAKKPATVPSPR